MKRFSIRLNVLLPAVLSLSCLAITLYVLCPRPELKTFTTYSSAWFDSRDRLLRVSLAEDQRYRLFESLDHISPDLISATLLYEDQGYYDHIGVDFTALVRAFWATFILRERRIGASTITMQVARLRWNIPSNTIPGKIHQIARAIQLSRHYSKQEILEAYLNLAPYGRNIEGIAAASLIYFNKKPNNLSLPEALTLAVIPQNPNKRNPTTASGYLHLLQARQNLFQRWLEDHPSDISKQTFFSMPLNVRPPENLPFLAPHFVNYVKQSMSRWDHGYINTTVDSVQQQSLEKSVSHYVSSKAASGINNAAALLLNYETMEIKAMVGSADFHNDDLQGQVNGTIAKRSPGSTLKPFVYALAMDEGLIHPMTLMKDSPKRFGGFSPENHDKKFMGPISARDALIQSRNVPAVDLQSQLTQQSFYDFLMDAGVTGLKDESYYGLALALGGGEVSMFELATLYAVLANKGVIKPIKSLQNAQGETTKQTPKRLLSAEASFLVLDILKDNPAPDALNFNQNALQKNQVAWKTGTSWAFRDAWAVGVSGPYVLVVWVGNFDGKGNNAFVGRSAAGPLLFSLLSSVASEKTWKVEDLITNSNPINSSPNIKQLNIKQLNVCKNTGDLAGKHCPSTVSSWFIPGVSPIKVSNIYRSIPIESSTGLRACWFEAGKTEMKTFEFWPSDFLHLFRQAGISLKIPPQYSTACSLDEKSQSGQTPVITSPQATIEYVIQSITPEQTNNASREIPFSAIVDPDVETLYWFVNSTYVGSAKRGEPFIWNASNGEYRVRVVDDLGRGASRKIKVLQIR